jgi:hypothetical protein
LAALEMDSPSVKATSETTAREPRDKGPGNSGIPPVSRIAVVHLVRAKNGIEPLRRFLDSYSLLSPGIPHDLLIIYKGFRGRIPPEFAAALSATPHREIHSGDIGYDIAPYFHAARIPDYDFLCFLNSFSVILDQNWLLKLYSHASREGVGIAGATGSWESVYSDLQGIIETKNQPPGVVRKRLRSLADTQLLKFYGKRFAPFPNFHIRTNAFMINRNLFLGIKRPRLILKIHAHEFESGRESLTGQILEKGLKPIVVGRDGAGYEKEHWHISGTFRQGEQGNLLVADNQTIRYHRLAPEEREKLRIHTWGAVSGTATWIGKGQQ